MSDRVVVNFTKTGKPVTHGGSGTAYANYGCRCDACTEANTIRVEIRRRARLREGVPSDAVHGSSSTYSNWGCRCDECRAAHSEGCKAQAAARRAAR